MRYLVVLALIGLAVYLLIALIQARGRRPGGSSGRGARPGAGPRPTRPLAPDDDPAFLAELDRRRREAERRARQEREGGPSPEAGSAGSDSPENRA